MPAGRKRRVGRPRESPVFSGWSAPISASSGHVYHSIKILAQRNFHRLLCCRRVGTWCGKSNWRVGDHVKVMTCGRLNTPGAVGGESTASRRGLPFLCPCLCCVQPTDTSRGRALGGQIAHDRLPCYHVRQTQLTDVCPELDRES